MMTIVLSFWQTMQKEVEIKPKTSICSKCWVQKGSSEVNFQLDWEWNVQTLVSESATRPRFLLSLSCRQQNIANSLQMSRSAFFKCDLSILPMISTTGNIFWKENNVGSLQPAKTSWWVANAKMIICELKRNAKSHTICIKALVSSIGCYFDCEAVDCSHSAEFSGWTYWLPPTDCPQWIGRDCHKTLKHVQGCSRNIRF